MVTGARRSCVGGWAIFQGRDLDGWKRRLPVASASQEWRPLSEGEVSVKSKCLCKWDEKWMQSLVVEVFSTMTVKAWQLCVWFLCFQHSYLLVPPSPGLRQKRRMWLTVPINPLMCLPVPARAMVCTCCQPRLSFSLLKQCSVMLCAYRCWQGQNSLSLKNVPSKTGSFQHSQTLVFQQEQLPNFHCCGNQGAPQLPPLVCARPSVLKQTALSSSAVSLHLRATCWAGRKTGNAAFFSIGMYRQGEVNLWIFLWLSGWLC